MNSAKESKNELEAAIRYAENAISSAKQTIESMEFRQQMAQKNYQEQTGREKALQNQVGELKSECAVLAERIDELKDSAFADGNTIKHLKEEREMLEKNVKYLRDENERQKRDLTVKTSQAEAWKKEARELKEGAPTMPVIPRDVAIAIFREGVLFGVNAACDEIEGERINISENDYVGDFSVSFERDIELDDVIDFDWVRSKIGDYDEDNVAANLEGLCARKNFECRIHGIDDQGNDSPSS